MVASWQRIARMSRVTDRAHKQFMAEREAYYRVFDSASTTPAQLRAAWARYQHKYTRWERLNARAMTELNIHLAARRLTLGRGF